MSRDPDTGSVADRQLVERAQRDSDMGAFEVLYRRYVERIHAFAYRQTGSAPTADDVTSATFERALRNLGSFRWRGGGFGPWLFRIAANEVTNHFRQVRRDSSPRSDRASRALYESEGATDVETEVLGSLEAARVRKALGRLKDRHQRVIALRYLSGLSHGEAAEAMGIPKGTFAVTLHRALKSLARELEVGEQEGSRA